MILGTAVVENEFIGAQREMLATSNFNIDTGITGLTIIVNEAPEVVIDEESDSEGEIEL